MNEDDLKGQGYYRNFIKNALHELKVKGVCYVYNKEQILEIKKNVKKEIMIEETTFGISKAYIITLKK